MKKVQFPIAILLALIFCCWGGYPVLKITNSFAQPYYYPGSPPPQNPYYNPYYCDPNYDPNCQSSDFFYYLYQIPGQLHEEHEEREWRHRQHERYEHHEEEEHEHGYR